VYGFNLAAHVGDDARTVEDNRQCLRRQLRLRREPGWLRQVHGSRVVQLPYADGELGADASWTQEAGLACVVLTADCLPVLFCDDAASVVAGAHAGWRGLAAGVLEATVAALPVEAHELNAWLGPAIGPAAFEVGEEVRAAFVRHDPRSGAWFVPSSRKDHFTADLFGLARLRLRQAGVHRVHGGGVCSYTDASRFYSFRREGVCGRFASLVWLTDESV
jgi:YfiH family protein